jgi:membrane-associated protease RseP (regulator of RpoE activity)
MLAGGGFAGLHPLAPFVALFERGLGAFVLGLLETAWAGLPFAVTVMLFFFAHEMGHFVACRRYGVESTLPFFIPAPPPFPFGTLGAVIRIRSTIPSRRALFDIGIAGPVAGFVVALPLVVYGTLTARTVPAALPPPGTELTIYGDSLLSWGLIRLLRPDAHGMELVVNPVFMAGWLGLLATAMNLIPAGQLDGGHLAYAIAPRWHRAIGLSAGGFLLGIVIVEAWRREFSAWFLWMVVVFVFGRYHPPIPEWDAELGPRRVALAAVALVMLLLCFMPVPLRQVR